MAAFPDYMYFRGIFILLGICGLFLNLSCVYLLISTNKKLRTQLKIMLSLSIYDLLIASLFVVKGIKNFDTVFQFITDDSGEDVGSHLLSSLFFCVQLAGLINMIAIAVDLLIRVKRPLHYSRLMSRKRGYVVVACTWIPSLVLLFMEIVAVLQFSFSVTIVAGMLYQLISVLVFVAFGVIYGCIICDIRKMNALNDRRLASRALRKIALTVACVLVSYVICLMPVAWLFLLIVTAPKKAYSLFTVALALEILFLLNSMIDPLIFIIRIPEVRKRFKVINQKIRLRELPIVTTDKQIT